jgi:16S rRNA G966 N2-methylase RsmD
MSEMMIVPYNKKPFFADDNTTRPERTEGGIEKRIVNEIVAKDRRWNFVLDCYAGFGISTLIFAKHAKKVYAVEKNLKYASAMWMNLRPYFFDNVIGHVIIIPKDNLDYLRVAPDEEQHPPDLIDLDPFASCKDQLKLALEWMQDGALLLTNGHIGRIARNMNWVQTVYPDIGNRYSGWDKVIDWPTKYFIPKKLEEPYKQLRVVHYYVHPTCVRIVCEVGKFRFSEETIKKLKERPKYLGRFGEMKKDEGRNRKRAVKGS